MARLLLLDADGHHARQVQSALRRLSSQTTICTDLQSVIYSIQRQRFDLIIVVADPGLDWDIGVEFVRHSAFRMPDPPQIVCLLRGPYQGPNQRVYAARRGFKVVYEQ